MNSVKTRFQRGMQIQAQGLVARTPDPNLFYVGSQTNPDLSYAVRWDPKEGQHECSCPARQDGSNGWCQHIHAADLFRLSTPLPVAPPKPPVEPENAALVEARQLIEELYGSEPGEDR